MSNMLEKVKNWIFDHDTSILVGVGSVCTVLGAVLTAKAAVKIDRKTTGEVKKKEIVKEFAPGVAILGVSIFCNVKSHLVDTERQAELAASLAGALGMFQNYRKNAVEKGVEEAETQYKQEVLDNHTEMYENDERKYTIFAKYWGIDYSSLATGDPEQDRIFLQNAEKELTERLRTVGRLSINEVYEYLCIEDAYGKPMKAFNGNKFGWKIAPGRVDFVSFDIFNRSVANVEFIQGFNDTILLDFNCDGFI